MRHLVAILVCAMLVWLAPSDRRETDNARFSPLFDTECRTLPRVPVTFHAGDGQAAVRGVRFTLNRVQRDGITVPRPTGMTLDPDSGRFSWCPTESQVGMHEVTFGVKDAAGRNTLSRWRIVVETPPVTTIPGVAGELLRHWYAAGTAAGHIGDYYDNRDDGHSMLKRAHFPQLDLVVYSDAQRARKLHWGTQRVFLFEHVTLGNSSTAAPAEQGGSNLRRALLFPAEMLALYRQYMNAHLYVYPAHHDYGPGRNGRSGYGDVFPANTPYAIASRGSSGSDQPFLEALALALGALRPEVKRALVHHGLLMPAVQMLMRSTLRTVRTPQDYLSGAAHPAVFDSADLDVARLVVTAHALTIATLPPLAQVRVIEEDTVIQGRDFFDPGKREQLFDTPCAVARVFRGSRFERRLLVSADASADVNGHALTYHWRLLRGDPARVTVRPLEHDGGVSAELRIAHGPQRWPVHPGSAIESSRVDIGLFVHNGYHFSAPAFVTVMFLDDEARTYAADGRVLDIGYGAGDSTIGYAKADLHVHDPNYDIRDWNALLALFRDEATGTLAATLLRARFAPAEIPVVNQLGQRLRAATTMQSFAATTHREAEVAWREATRNERATVSLNPSADPELAPARGAPRLRRGIRTRLAALKNVLDTAAANHQAALTARDLARQKTAGILTTPVPAIGASLQVRLERALNDLRADPDLFFRNQAAVRQLASNRAVGGGHQSDALESALQRLRRRGMVRTAADGDSQPSPLLEPLTEGGGWADRLTACERQEFEWFNIAIMEELLFPGVLHRPRRTNMVDPRLSAAKDWRDVYRTTADGRADGWIRYHDEGVDDFAPEGTIVLQRDALGRVVLARTVSYVLVPRKDAPPLLRHKPGSILLRTVYQSDADRVGRTATAPAPAD